MLVALGCACRFNRFSALQPYYTYLLTDAQQCMHQWLGRHTSVIACGQVPRSLPSCPPARLRHPADFSYRCHVFGGNPFLLPGLEAWLK